MWRFASIALLIAACSPSPEERLADLEHDTTVLCLDISCSVPQPGGLPIATIVDCMNTALQDGRTAEAKWSGNDKHYNEYTTYVFATNHEVQEIDVSFYDVTAPDVYAPPSCKGPFKPGMMCGPEHYVPAWDGCP